MDDLRKQNLKSIVAQRLALFNALQQGRPRSDDGSPVLYSQGEFIFNSSLDSTVILDIKKAQQKRKAREDNSVYENCIITEHSAASEPEHKNSSSTKNSDIIYSARKNCSLNENSSHNNPADANSSTYTILADGNIIGDIPMEGSRRINSFISNDNPHQSYTVKQLRSLFDGSAVKLTARNSLERNARLDTNGNIGEVSVVNKNSLGNSIDGITGVKSTLATQHEISEDNEQIIVAEKPVCTEKTVLVDDNKNSLKNTNNVVIDKDQNNAGKETSQYEEIKSFQEKTATITQNIENREEKIDMKVNAIAKEPLSQKKSNKKEALLPTKPFRRPSKDLPSIDRVVGTEVRAEPDFSSRPVPTGPSLSKQLGRTQSVKPQSVVDDSVSTKERSHSLPPESGTPNGDSVPNQPLAHFGTLNSLLLESLPVQAVAHHSPLQRETSHPVSNKPTSPKTALLPPSQRSPKPPSSQGAPNSFPNNHKNTKTRAEAIKSVYVEPSFKVSENAYENTEQTEQTTPKKRTLGRGEIKPYEVVDLVQQKNSEQPSEQKGDLGLDKSKRIESMYVDTHKSFDSYSQEGVDGDGYQTIPEGDEVQDRSLDKHEYDLSNLNSSNSKDNSLSMPTSESDEHRFGKLKSLGKVNSLNSSMENSFMSVSSACQSDLGDGWDSDEFDYDTDDEVLEDTRPRAKTFDGDVSKKKIFNIVNEILTTEKAYEKRLHLLDKVFQAKLMKEAKENSSIPEKVIQEIFSNLSSIYIFHSTMLLPDLEKRISNWSTNEKIGDIFKTLGHCLKLYTDYVKNFDHATSTLTQWMKKSPKFASIVEDIQKLPECENLTLQHHMLEPIQRVPRYKLLLKDYLKKLPEDSSDRAEAEESLVVISEAADHANNSMKSMDKFKKLVELEERITEGLHGESLATASRVFIKEGELVKIAARSDQKNVRVLLLFNDLLLCCSKLPATGKLKVKQMMDIPGMSLQDNEDIDLGETHAFRVKSRQRVLDLAATSDDEKNDWMIAIAGVIKDYEAKRGSLLKQYIEEDAQKEAKKSGSLKMGEAAPVWVKDEDVTMCMLCAVRFSLLSRRHHCRSCGRIVCDNCSKYKAQLAYINNSVKRVCYVCHRKLNIDKLQQTDSFIQKNQTIDKVQRDPKRRRSTLVSEVKGELFWKSPGKKWDKGWFEISDLVLYRHKGRKDPKAQMTIALPGYTVSRPSPSDDIDEGKHPFAFKLHFGNKKEMTYFFQAEDEIKMERWMDVITYSIKAEKPPWSKTL